MKIVVGASLNSIVSEGQFLKLAMTILISLSRFVIRHNRKGMTVYLTTCRSQFPPFCKRQSAAQFQLFKCISSSGISHLGEKLHRDVTKIRPYWKDKKDLQSRSIKIPNEDLHYFISRKLKSNISRGFLSNVLILFRDRENPPHFVIVAPDKGIHQAESQLQKLLNNFNIQNIPLPDNECKHFISRLVIGKKNKFEGKFKVMVRVKNQDASFLTEDTSRVVIMSESAEKLKIAAEYMIHQIHELQQKLNIKKLVIPNYEYQVFIIRWLCREHKTLENKFKVLLSISTPTEDHTNVVVACESEKNVSKAEKFIKSQIEKLRQKLNIKNVIFPNYEYPYFIIRYLAYDIETFKNRFNVVAEMKGQGISYASKDPPHIVILSESEYNVKKAAEFMEHHIKELVQKLNIKKIFFPDNWYPQFIFRLLNENVKAFEDRFNVFVLINNQNASILTEDPAHVVIVSGSEENVKKATAYVEHYMLNSEQTFKFVNVPLPYNKLHFIVRLLEDKHKTFEEEFKVLFLIRGEGTSFPTADPPHVLIVCESEEKIKKAVECLQCFIQIEYIQHFIEKNIKKKYEITPPHAF